MKIKTIYRIENVIPLQPDPLRIAIVEGDDQAHMEQAFEYLAPGFAPGQLHLFKVQTTELVTTLRMNKGGLMPCP